VAGRWPGGRDCVADGWLGGGGLAAERARRADFTAPYSLLCVELTPGRQLRTIGLVGAYLLLFLLGVMEGLIGSFQFSHTVGVVPVAALGFCLLILLTCMLAGRGMGTLLGALAPAAGWLITSLVLTLPTSGGSVIVTNTSAGMWYLYGGTLSASVGVALVLRGRRVLPRGSTGDRATTRDRAA
jgi:Family of unknown function (DUF6113)